MIGYAPPSLVYDLIFGKEALFLWIALLRGRNDEAWDNLIRNVSRKSPQATILALLQA